ncbi:MAG TPA: hypothetical protein VHM91_08380 [Verrucomicrobiales bacterium]|nr:hypothetical protein [Verrucomicrobiales bacterium]
MSAPARVLPRLCPSCSSGEVTSSEQDVCGHCGWRGIVCPLCCHAEANSRHHGVPASQGGREIVLLCRPCHSQVHATFTNKQLEKRYSTVEKLLESDEIWKFAQWRHKHPAATLRTVSSKARRRYSPYA